MHKLLSSLKGFSLFKDFSGRGYGIFNGGGDMDIVSEYSALDDFVINYYIMIDGDGALPSFREEDDHSDERTVIMIDNRDVE